MTNLHFLVQLLVARHFNTDPNSGLDPLFECGVFPIANGKKFNVDSEADVLKPKS